jgi:hypothetical protein
MCPESTVPRLQPFCDHPRASILNVTRSMGPFRFTVAALYLRGALPWTCVGAITDGASETVHGKADERSLRTYNQQAGVSTTGASTLTEQPQACGWAARGCNGSTAPEVPCNMDFLTGAPLHPWPETIMAWERASHYDHTSGLRGVNNAGCAGGAAPPPPQWAPYEATPLSADYSLNFLLCVELPNQSKPLSIAICGPPDLAARLPT